MDDAIERCRRRLIELEEKVSKLKGQLEIKKFIKIKNPLIISPLEDSDLEEDISYLKDLIEFYSKEAEKCNVKLKKLEESDKKQIGDEKEKLSKLDIEKDLFSEFKAQKPLVKYAIPFAVLLLVILSLFLFKTGITGYVVAEKEIAYSENLNLKINESGEYNWALKNPGNMKHLKATGNVAGNGTVKIYIEKDGKKYLIYSNK